MDNILLKFFLPAFDGSVHAALQLTFATVFVAAVVVMPRLVRRAARSGRWEQNLARLEAKDGPAAHHGTAEGLAAAVATPAERWADALPGLLLVFGLLGTFIGLGLALTEAAGALGPGNDALSSLTPIMDSLGSKFKTSTWGILSFLSLKVLFMLRPYEEARLAWAAQKTGAWAAQADLRRRQQNDEDRLQLVNAIVQAGGAIVAEQQRAGELAGASHAQSLKVMGQLVAEQERTTSLLQNAAKHELSALAQIGERLAAISQHHEALAARVDTLVEHGERQTGKTGEQLERLAEMAEHAAASRVAMDSFVHGVSDNMATMAKAADGMAVAASAAGTASAELGSVIGEFRSQMIGVLGEVKHDLNNTIERMSVTFGTNMGTMSADLSKATASIGDAIGQLSGGVADTLKMLNDANEESITRQTKAQATFAASGEQLMGSMGTMQAFVEEMQQKITTGLSSVATASQQMRGFEKHLDKNHEQAAALLASVNTLASEIGKTTASLQAVATLGGEVRELVGGIEQQVQAQAEAARRQQQQTEVSERVVSTLLPLTDAITGMASALKEEQGSKTGESILAVLGRIETRFADVTRPSHRSHDATSQTPA
jgi:chromosome segregation ATPase